MKAIISGLGLFDIFRSSFRGLPLKLNRQRGQVRTTCTRPPNSYVQGQRKDERTREYFYFIDHHGQLFLDDTKIKNFVTCFKDPAFLSFFFMRLKINKGDQYRTEFPYISPCGREMNYIRCEDLPIVFTHILQDTETKETVNIDELQEVDKLSLSREERVSEAISSTPNDSKSHDKANMTVANRNTEKSSQCLETPDCSEVTQQRHLLSYGGTTAPLKDRFVPFEPWALVMDEVNGRVYHPAPKKFGGIGLVKSSLALQIASHFVYDNKDDLEASTSHDNHVEEGADFTPRPTHFVWNGTFNELDYKLYQHISSYADADGS